MPRRKMPEDAPRTFAPEQITQLLGDAFTASVNPDVTGPIAEKRLANLRVTAGVLLDKLGAGLETQQQWAELVAVLVGTALAAHVLHGQRKVGVESSEATQS